jgi:3-oxoacyl-[acyl-carrier-protein] synthase-3
LRDAAPSVLLESVEAENNPERHGIHDFALGSEGEYAEILYQPAGGSSHPPTHKTVLEHGHFAHMTGREVYVHAVRRMEQTILDVVDKGGLKPEDIAWFVPHQANSRIIETICQRMGLPPERFYLNIDRYGNTTSATIPLCLDELNVDGKLKPGDKIVMFTFGTGLTWGSCLLTWGGP